MLFTKSRCHYLCPGKVLQDGLLANATAREWHLPVPRFSSRDNQAMWNPILISLCIFPAVFWSLLAFLWAFPKRHGFLITTVVYSYIGATSTWHRENKPQYLLWYQDQHLTRICIYLNSFRTWTCASNVSWKYFCICLRKPYPDPDPRFFVPNDLWYWRLRQDNRPKHLPGSYRYLKNILNSFRSANITRSNPWDMKISAFFAYVLLFTSKPE